MNIDIEKLLKEAKILYWKEYETSQQNHIGIQGNLKNSTNKDVHNILQLEYQISKE
jgi:hypothetical protein